jgi:D-3-phosphoglycerate dehydrogenase / 2-oxoglutarate reductase
MTPRFKVVVTDQVFPSVETERRMLAEVDADLVVADGTRQGVASMAADADALLNTYLPIDEDLLAQLTRCRIVARYGIGVDNIDLRAAARRGITVTNVPDYSVEEVAAHALAMILALLRRLPTADALVRDGTWSIDPLRPIRRISGLTFGLVGYGRISRRLGASIAALGGRLVAHDPYLRPGDGLPPLVSLDELLEMSDVVSIHAPATAETRGLFDAARLARMRRGTILVNTSRGPLVVLSALMGALRSGHLGGAGLDVFEHEPPDPGDLANVPGLLLSPHMAYYSEESLAESQRKAATQVVKVLTGQPPDYAVTAD